MDTMMLLKNRVSSTSNQQAVKVNIHFFIIPHKIQHKMFVLEYPSKLADCKTEQLTAIGNRLLDWFSVIMTDSKKRRQHSQKLKGLHSNKSFDY